MRNFVYPYLVGSKSALAIADGLGSIIEIYPNVRFSARYYYRDNPDLIALENDANLIGMDFAKVLISKPALYKRRTSKSRYKYIQSVIERRNLLLRRFAAKRMHND